MSESKSMLKRMCAQDPIRMAFELDAKNKQAEELQQRIAELYSKVLGLSGTCADEQARVKRMQARINEQQARIVMQDEALKTCRTQTMNMCGPDDAGRVQHYDESLVEAAISAASADVAAWQEKQLAPLRREVGMEPVGIVRMTAPPDGTPKPIPKWIMTADQSSLKDGDKLYAEPKPAPDLQKRVRELEAVEANLCKLHNVALEENAQLTRKLAEQRALMQPMAAALETCIMVDTGGTNKDQMFNLPAVQSALRLYYRNEESTVELTTLLSAARAEGFADGSANAGFAHALDCNKAFDEGKAKGVEEGKKMAVPEGSASAYLRDLVDALDTAFISSWQTTADWQSQLDAARDYLAAAPKPKEE